MDANNIDLDKARSWFESQAAAASAVANSLKDTAIEKASQLAPDTPASNATADKERKDAEIEKNDLMHLCMKMNKKIKSLEAKVQGLEKWQGALLDERRALVTAVKAHIPVPIVVPMGAPSKDDTGEQEARSAPIDVEKVEIALRTYVELQEKERASMLNQIGVTFSSDDQISENNTNQSGVLRAKEAQLSSMMTQTTHLKKTMEEQETLFVEEKQHLKETIRRLETEISDSSEKIRVLEVEVEVGERSKRELEDARDTVKSMTMILEEKELGDANQKEMIHYLQERLNDIDTEHNHMVEEKRGMTSQLSSHELLKAEQEALLTSLRVSLKEALDSNSKLEAEVVMLRMFKEQNEDKAIALDTLGEECDGMRDKLAEQAALITRLRQEGEKSSQNHAMRTAVLATTESELEAAREEVRDKEEELGAAKAETAELQERLRQEESRQDAMFADLRREISELKNQQEKMQEAHAVKVRKLVEERHAEAEKAQRDYSKKSGVARQLLQEREEDIRLLNEKIDALVLEIRSGAPNERRIFEIAKSQAQREHLHSVKLDTREMAFQQLQEKISLKDLQLAQLQATNSGLQTEVAQLSRVAKREGVNMDYLKNVVLQYITFPLQSPERESLVPVLSMLLQFSNEETRMCANATSNPSWTARLPIEINVEALRMKSSSAHG